MDSIKRSMAFLFIVGLVVLAGCIGTPPTTTPTPTGVGIETPPPMDAKTLNVGWQTWYTPTWAGGVIVPARHLDKQYLPGVDVTYFSGLQGTVLINNMIAGKTDFAYMGDMPSNVGGSKDNADIRAVALCGWDDEMCMQIHVPKDSDIKTVKDLEGKRISVPKGACSHYFLEETLAKNGVKATVLDQSIEVGLANIRAGKVDAWAPWEPGASQMINLGVTRLLTRGRDQGVPHTCYIVANQDYLQKHPKATVAWLKAEMAAKDFIYKNPDDAAKIIADQIGIVPLDVVKMSMKSWILDTVPPKIAIEHQKKAGQFLFDQKFITRTPFYDEKNPKYYFQLDYVNQAAKELEGTGIKGQIGDTPHFKELPKNWNLLPEYKAPPNDKFPPQYP